MQRYVLLRRFSAPYLKVRRDHRKKFIVGQDNRLKILQDMILERKLCAALIFYSRDVFYYTGTAQPSYLIVLPQEFFLFLRSGYEFTLNETFISKDKIIEERRLDLIFDKVFSRVKAGRKIGTELDILPTTQFQEFKKVFSGYEFVNISPLVLEQRKRKDASKINKIKKACEAIDLGHHAVLSTLREGLTELAAAVEYAHRLAGHEV